MAEALPEMEKWGVMAWLPLCLEPSIGHTGVRGLCIRCLMQEPGEDDPQGSIPLHFPCHSRAQKGPRQNAVLTVIN